jgi:SPP1 family predicted phage head-tail adaptor
VAFRTTDRQAAGRRDRLVTIEQRPTADAAAPSGFPLDGAWTPLVVDMPAARQDVQGFERYRAAQTSAASDVRWEINYRLDMDPERIDVPKTRRLIYRGRVYNIVAASMLGRRRGVELWTQVSTKLVAAAAPLEAGL